MKAKGVRLYGAHDIRLEEFELPEIKDDEILVRVVSDSICMSTWKMVQAGRDHKRVPENVAEHPVIIGHEFTGDIVQVLHISRDTVFDKYPQFYGYFLSWTKIKGWEFQKVVLPQTSDILYVLVVKEKR